MSQVGCIHFGTLHAAQGRGAGVAKLPNNRSAAAPPPQQQQPAAVRREKALPIPTRSFSPEEKRASVDDLQALLSRFASAHEI